MLHILCSILVMLVASVHAVSRPPGIFINPAKNIFYKPAETVQVVCEAEGSPQPRYRWTRNKMDFNPSGNDARVVQLPNAGTLVFNSPEEKDEGMYQCFAINDFGTSVSINVNMRVAKLEEFQQLDDEFHTPTQGDHFTLECVPPTSFPDAEVIWIIKHELGFDAVNYDARVSMDREFRLRFTHVTKEDEQNGNPYACMAMNKIMRSSVQSHLHFVKVQGAERWKKVANFWSDPFDLLGYQGDSFSMQCIFSGNPTPDIQWERSDGKPLPSRAKLLSFAQVLQIDDLQFEDQGSYMCWATNAFSAGQKAMRNFKVQVKSRPKFIEAPKDVEIGVGGNVEFNCEASGDPSPEIQWTINGLALDDPNLKVKKFERPIPTKLFFGNVSETDHMVIQCNASNKFGYQFADVFLNVLSEAPEFITPPKPLVISAEGLNVNLTCRTTGKPDPIITWHKDGGQVSGGRFQILEDGTLHIKGVVLADASHYHCTAVNRYGEVSGEGTLIIRRKTRIEQKPGDLERNAGMDAKFTCSGTTDPEEVQNLRIYWLKDGEEILANDQRTTTNYQDNSLTISGTMVRDSGTYTCVATNGLDKAKASAVLTVRDKPDRPRDVFQRDCDKFKTTIEWTPGSFNNAPLQYYILQYMTVSNSDQWTFAMKINGTWSKLDYNILPGVTYQFRLIAFNKIGESSPSVPTPTICKGDIGQPAHQPKNLRTLGHEWGKLYIEWTPIPPVQHGGPGFKYELTINRIGDNNKISIESPPITSWSTNVYTTQSDKAYQRYEITIKASNVAFGAAGNPTKLEIGHSYEDTPTVLPSDFTAKDVGDTYADLTWSFPRKEIGKVDTKIKGEFMGFKIQFWQLGYKDSTIREFDVGPESAANITGNTFSSRVGNMLPNTRMEARISVMNNYYIGEPSDIIRFNTEPGFPGPVEFFRIINIGDTHVNLEWGRPLEDRGDLEGYDMSYQLVKGLELGEMQEREPQINDRHTTNGILSGLEPRSKYRVYIFARTVKGRGEGYFIELVTTKPVIPEIPDFTIPNIGKTYVNVSWWVDAYKSTGSVIFVEYRKLDGAEWLRTSDEVVHTWQKLSNLEPGTKYEIRIKATNGVVSIPSSIEEVHTDGNAKAYDLIENIGWFFGVLLSVLLIIVLIVVFMMRYKQGFRFTRAAPPDRYNSSSGVAYSGTYDHTAHINKEAEPKGYNNEYYDDKDNYEYDDSNRPPSYTSEIDNRNGRYPPQATAPTYEDYDRKPSRGGYDDYEPQDDYPQKRDDNYDRRDNDYYDQDRRDDGYDYDNRDYDGYDYNDDYDRRQDDDDYYNNRGGGGGGDNGNKRQSGNMDLRRDDGYDYDSEDTGRRPAPRGGGGGGGAPSSTFV